MCTVMALPATLVKDASLKFCRFQRSGLKPAWQRYPNDEVHWQHSSEHSHSPKSIKIEPSTMILIYFDLRLVDSYWILAFSPKTNRFLSSSKSRPWPPCNMSISRPPRTRWSLKPETWPEIFPFDTSFQRGHVNHIQNSKMPKIRFKINSKWESGEKWDDFCLPDAKWCLFQARFKDQFWLQPIGPKPCGGCEVRHFTRKAHGGAVRVLVLPPFLGFLKAWFSS